MVVYKTVGYFLFFLNIILALDRYPAWFIHPDTSREIMVGYTYGKSSSLFDARRTYCTYQNCVIDGFVLRYNRYDQRVNDYHYIFDQDCLDSLDNQLVLLSRFTTNIILRDSIALYGFQPGIAVDNELIDMRETPAPAWVKHTFWEDDATYYSVGVYSSKRNENDAWKAAEEKGLFELMNSIAIKYFGVKIHRAGMDNNDSETAEAVQLKYHLKNIRIIERWANIAESQFYVLVKIPKKDVYSPFMKTNP